jgi:TRAP-type mannitol/chloroaromatic compound transport system permease small subunit
MERYIRFADTVSAWFGKVFAWCVVLMTLGIGYEVVARYFFHAPTPWAFDFGYMMYGTMFMMAGAYTLSREGHVRGDFVYRLWSPRTQARVEFVLYFLFFFPGVLALIFAGWRYASRSWSYLEVSSNSPAGIPIYQLKSVIVAAGILLFIQGIAQVMRCIIAMRNNEWPKPPSDVEELEKILQEQGGGSLDSSSEAIDVVLPAQPKNGDERP